jgi:serine/threonine-protein kinase
MPIETINEIELVRSLGRGVFGEVHAATLPPHGSVAVKVIKCADVASFFGIPSSDWPAIRAAMFAEAEALSRGEHANVVRVHGAQYDASKDNGYIVMKLCDCSIANLIANGPLPLANVDAHLRHALIGLETLHGRSMIHRDLKPPNILIANGLAKLSDFGLVTDHLVGGYAARAGYIEHFAPEVFTTNQTSFRTDVWAMGLTAYQMLNGVPWYLEVLHGLGADKIADPRGARARIIHIVQSGSFAQKLTFLPHVPDGWRRFVRKALHADPHQRFADAATMLTAMSSRSLPLAPSYECVFDAAGNVTWRRTRGDREEVIEWTRGPHAINSVIATSRPVGGGNGRVLRRVGRATRTQALAALQAFFSARTS